MAYLAVAPTKYAAGIEAPGTRARRSGEPRTYDWRAPPGDDENTAGIEAVYRVTALLDALKTTYETDAHFVAYILRHRNGSPLSCQPRINKSALGWLENQGYEVKLGCLVADVDNPGHAAWSSPEIERAEAERVSVLLETCGIYTTAHGMRVLQPLKREIPIQDAEGCLRAWLADLEGKGLAVDWSCTDWTRHFRLPNVRREASEHARPRREAHA